MVPKAFHAGHWKKQRTKLPHFCNLYSINHQQQVKSQETGNKPMCLPCLKEAVRKKLATIYRPVSLASKPCKIIEHIIFHHIMDHLDVHHLLIKYQHGFCWGHSCERQPITRVEHLARNLDHGKQTDVLLLDFSKTFNMVPHKRLLKKLDHYGIYGQLIKWIQSWLSRRTC